MAYDQATTYETIELFGLTEKDAHLPIPQDDILKDSIIREAFETLLGQLRNTGLEGEIEPLAHGLATILQRRKVALGKEVDRTADKIGALAKCHDGSEIAETALEEATQVSDFDFRTIRKKPFTVYLVVQPLMVKPLAPLIRLFFSDLLSAMQEKEPGKDEPWPVMIMLDEFNRLGKMPIVVESIETLRTYRGHLAVVTQTIPALDEIYGENTRRALQGNAGVKLYLTPSDEKTIEELSKAVGKTTKTVITRSRSIGKNPFEGRSQSTRTEETSLLPEDEARRLPLDEIIMVVDAQMPVRAKRIQYYDDRLFAAIHGAQKGELPFPQLGKGGGGVSGSESGGSRQNANQEGIGANSHKQDERLGDPQDVGAAKSVSRLKKRSGAVQVVVEEGQRQQEMNFADQDEMQLEERDGGDRDRLDLAVDDLGGLEDQLKLGEGVSS